MENKNIEINQWHERKQFLLRGIYNNNIEEKFIAEAEIEELEKKIKAKLRETLDEQYDELRATVKVIKREVNTDGEMKRGIAGAIIKILEDLLPASELKGVFRQGYKIMRTRC